MKISCLFTLAIYLLASILSTATAILDPLRLAHVVEDIDSSAATPKINLTDNENSLGAIDNPPVSRLPKPFSKPDVESKFSSSFAPLPLYFQYHAQTLANID
jgi:hypothetical protein